MKDAVNPISTQWRREEAAALVGRYRKAELVELAISAKLACEDMLERLVEACTENKQLRWSNESLERAVEHLQRSLHERAFNSGSSGEQAARGIVS